MWNFIYKLASPKSFYQLAGKWLPWLWLIWAVLFIYGLIGGLLLAPPDYQQGDAFRIIYIHVPCSAWSLGIYMVMAICAAIHLIWRIKLADIIAKASAPIGAWYTFIALVTGSLWGKPMWGTWWIWDARLTSELILLFLYLGIIALRNAITDIDKAARATAILAIVGVIDIPIIHYSVYWWNTLHQQATLLRFSKPSIVPSMLYPLLAMLAAFLMYYLVIMLMRARNEVLWREREAHWVKQLIK
jgi:heme exporter protein C